MISSQKFMKKIQKNIPPPLPKKAFFGGEGLDLKWTNLDSIDVACRAKISFAKSFVLPLVNCLFRKSSRFAVRDKTRQNPYLRFQPSPPLFVTKGGGELFGLQCVIFVQPKTFFLGTRGHFNGGKFFFRKKKTKMTKKLNFENTKPPAIFHFPIFLWGGGGKSLKNFNFHFTIASWVFIRFWRLYPQNFINWLCFSNLLKNLKNCGLNKPKTPKSILVYLGFFFEDLLLNFAF